MSKSSTAINQHIFDNMMGCKIKAYKMNFCYSFFLRRRYQFFLPVCLEGYDSKKTFLITQIYLYLHLTHVRQILRTVQKGNFEMLKGCASVFEYHAYIPILCRCLFHKYEYESTTYNIISHFSLYRLWTHHYAMVGFLIQGCNMVSLFI